MATGSKTVIYAALFGNLAIAITKFIASVITSSSAMLTESIHSLVDTGNQALLLLGLRRAKRPPDERFPFGHGKEVYFWSFVVAILLFAIGAGVSIYEGIKHINHPEPVTNPMINYVVLTLAMCFEGVAWWLAFKGFRHEKGSLGWFQAVREGKDPTFFVVLFEDSAAMLGLVVAFLGVLLGQLTGHPEFDGAASVVVGCILAFVAIWLAWETKSLLIGEAASPRIKKGIRELLEGRPLIDSVNEVATLQMGPEHVIVTLSLEFRDALRLEEVEDEITSINREIRSRHADVQRVFIEAESKLAHEAQMRAWRAKLDGTSEEASPSGTEGDAASAGQSESE